MKSKDNRYWFRPKKYGYGAYPTSWQGWITILVFILVLFLIIFFLSFNRYLFYSSFILWFVLITYISMKKTDGKWTWRWGN